MPRILKRIHLPRFFKRNEPTYSIERSYKKYYKAILNDDAKIVSRLLRKKFVDLHTIFQAAPTDTRIIYFMYENESDCKTIIDLETYRGDLDATTPPPSPIHSIGNLSNGSEATAHYYTSNSTIWTVDDEITPSARPIQPQNSQRIHVRAEITGDIIREQHEGCSAFTLSVQCRSRRVLRVLLRSSAPPEWPDFYGEDALFTSFRLNDKQIMKMLVKRGYNVNDRVYPFPEDRPPGQSFMHLAPADKEIIRLLLKAGADVNGQDDYGSTPLIEATKTANTAKVKLLIKYGADLDLLDKSGRSALDYTASNKCSSFLISVGKKQRKQSVVAPTAVWKTEQMRKQSIEQDRVDLDKETSKSLSSMETIYESDHESFGREVEVKPRTPYTNRHAINMTIVNDDELPGSSTDRFEPPVERSQAFITAADAGEYSSSESDDDDYQSLKDFTRTFSGRSSIYNSLVRFHRDRSFVSRECDDDSLSDATYYDALSRFGSKRSAFSILSERQFTIAPQSSPVEIDRLPPLQDHLILQTQRLSERESSREDSDTESALDLRRQTVDQPQSSQQGPVRDSAVFQRRVSWPVDTDPLTNNQEYNVSRTSTESSIASEDNSESSAVSVSKQQLSREEITSNFLHVPSISQISDSSNKAKHQSEPIPQFLGEVRIPSLQRHLSDNTGQLSWKRKQFQMHARRRSSDAVFDSLVNGSPNETKKSFVQIETNNRHPEYIEEVCSLHEAVKSGNSTAIQHHIDQGTDVNLLDDYGHTVFMVAARVLIDNTVLDDLNALLSLGADLDQWDWDRYTALHHATMNNNIPLVVFLISNGADLNARGCNGYTPLMEATKRFQDQSLGNRWSLEANLTREIIRLLLQANVDVNVKSRDKHRLTALELALPQPMEIFPLSYVAMIASGIEIIESVMYMLIVAGSRIPSRNWIDKWISYGSINDLTDRELYLLESIMKLEAWFEGLRTTVRTLTDLSRITVRKHLRMDIAEKVCTLPITPELCAYLLLEDINVIDEVN